MKKLSIFISGGGSNFRAIKAAIDQDQIAGEIVLVVASKRDCPGAEYARSIGLPVSIFPEEGISEADLLQQLQDSGTDFIILAGYIKLIPEEIVGAYRQRMLNIHPALLPAFGGKGFYGKKIHQGVLDRGAKITGVTVHFVDEFYDHGPIIAQAPVAVRQGDTADILASRVLEMEHRLYPRVVGAICRGDLVWDGEIPFLDPPLSMENE
ncbi:phosphoribosylglycinamide formyltransferase [Candidatus Neomarinimicrobiota bacterium]